MNDGHVRTQSFATQEIGSPIEIADLPAPECYPRTSGAAAKPNLSRAEEFARLAGQLHAEPQEQRTLDRIVSLAVDTVDPADSCCVTLRRSNGELVTAAASDTVAREATELQELVGEGPYFAITSNLGMVSVDDLTIDRRWPQLSRAAAGLGVRSMLSIRLDLHNASLTASLNLLAKEAYAFDPTDLAIASIFARHAASALDNARQGENLRAAARSRQIIGVAQGMLMQRFGVSLDQSFELLRRYSQTNNIKLRVLAERLAESGGLSAAGDPADSLKAAFGLHADD